MRLSDFRGSWVAVAFLYTHCPDVCPLIAQNLNAALAKARDLRVVAVSVDPKGDTPAAVRAFMRSRRLPGSFHYLIGSRPAAAAGLAVVARGHRARAEQHGQPHVVRGPGRSAGAGARLLDAQVQAADVLQDLHRLRGTV